MDNLIPSRCPKLDRTLPPVPRLRWPRLCLRHTRVCSQGIASSTRAPRELTGQSPYPQPQSPGWCLAHSGHSWQHPFIVC